MNATIFRRLATSVLIGLSTTAVFADDKEPTRPRGDPAMDTPVDRQASTPTNRASNPQVKSTADEARVNSIIMSWPERPRLGAATMIAQYGLPQEATERRLVWHNAGQFKRICVMAEETPHDFPLPHTDFLEHTIAYQVPADKVDEVVMLDGSTTVNRTAGELSVRCDLESHNILTLNLSNDVATGKKSVEQARKEFADSVVQEITGQQPKQVMALTFDVQEPQQAMFVDESNIPGVAVRAENPTDGVRPYDGNRADESAKKDSSNTANATNRGNDQKQSDERTDAAGGTSAGDRASGQGGDAEILASIMAIDHNEVVAALLAQKKELSPPVLEYAKMLNRDHGQNIVKGTQLGQQINVRPLETAHVDLMKRQGAADLANIVRLDGPSFEAAYLDAMIKGHQQALTVIDQTLLKSVKNDQLKQHLTASREHVAHHLDQAKQLRGNIGR